MEWVGTGMDESRGACAHVRADRARYDLLNTLLSAGTASGGAGQPCAPAGFALA